MSSTVVFIYYLLLVLCTFLYLFKRNSSYVNIRDIIYALTFLTTSVGGVFCAYGYASLELCELRINVLLCYILFFVVLTFSFVCVGDKKTYAFGEKLNIKISDRAIWTVYTFILIYTISYFAFLGFNLPLLNLIKSGDVASAIITRLEVTHDIQENYSLPFIFRYAKFVRETPMFLLMCLSFIKYLQDKRYKMMFLIIFVTTAFYQTYAIEKAGIVYMLIMLFFCYVQTQGHETAIFKQVVRIIILSSICLYFMYSFFMGQEENIFTSIFNRTCLRQTGWIYFQDVILEKSYGGCLYGNGMTMFFFDSLLGRSPVALSQEVYTEIYYQYSKEGYIGTTGGMPMFYLYSNLGLVLGSIVFFYLCKVVAKIDNTLQIAHQYVSNKNISIASQATFLCLCIQGFMGNLSTVFMLPFFWAPQVLALLLTIYSLKKIS